MMIRLILKHSSFGFCGALAVFFMMFVSNTSQAQTIQLNASADRNEIQIADPFEFEIRVTATRGTKVSFPQLGEKIGSFDILDVKDRKDSEAADSQQETWTHILVLETIDTGKLEIPSIEVAVEQPDRKPELLRTKPVAISVASVVEANADLTRFNDIADLIDVDVPEAPINNFVWISVAAGLALALATGCLFLASRPPVFESASAWALGQLQEANGDFNRTEGILRRFFEEHFAFPAESLGTAALVGTLSERNVDEKLVAEVEEILAASERVKFGGSTLSAEERIRMVEKTRSLIVQLGNTEASSSAHQEVA